MAHLSGQHFCAAADKITGVSERIFNGIFPWVEDDSVSLRWPSKVESQVGHVNTKSAIFFSIFLKWPTSTHLIYTYLTSYKIMPLLVPFNSVIFLCTVISSDCLNGFICEFRFIYLTHGMIIIQLILLRLQWIFPKNIYILYLLHLYPTLIIFTIL